MDPYVQIKAGTSTFRTKAHDNAGKTPAWFDTFEFKRTNEEAIQFNLYDEDVGKDDLIGTGSLYLGNICVPGSKPYSDSIPLKYGDKDAGELFLEVIFTPDK